jgi:NAD(P)-dependent dehydrogenase (short-subunit alcohol dehydrogenase family)
MGSIGGRIGQPFVGPYSASKAALASISESLRRELRPWGIWVAVVEPGSVATPIWDKGQRRAAEFIDRLPPQGRELYGETLERFSRVAGKVGERGIPADRVAEVVEHVLTAPRPRARYLLGPEARIQFVLSRVLPARGFDGLLDRVTRLAGR